MVLSVLEIGALVVATRVDQALPPMTLVSISAAILCLLVGIVPLLLRPSPTTGLGGIMIVLLAAFILVPVRPGMVADRTPGMLLTSAPAFVLFRLLNGAFLAATAFHVAAYFPRPVVATGDLPHTQGQIRLNYGATALLVGALLLTKAGIWRMLFFGAVVVWTYSLVVRVVRRLTSLSRDQRVENSQAAQQARVLLISALLAAIPSLLLNLLELAFGAPLARADLAAIFLVIFPVGTAYAILRHDLLRIESAVRRTLAYSAISAVALLVYFGVTLLLTVGLVRRQPELALVATAVSVLAATFVFAPLQQRIQGLVDRWLYPERQHFARAVAAAQAELGNLLAREAVITLLNQTLPAQIGARWAQLTLAPQPAAPLPQDSPTAWSGALAVGDTIMGRYWLGPRRTLLGYEADEQAQLQALLGNAALVLAYGETIAALQAFNQELEERVTTRTAQLLTQQRALAAHEQRQALARNLHDSVTQSLFSLNLSLGAMRKLAQRDPQAAVAELGAQEAAAQQALAEMRTLLTQLRSEEAPTAADAVDLGGALQRLCGETATRHGFQIQQQLATNVMLPQPIVDELLAIVREALHNVVKHSGVTSATVTLAQTPTALVLTISDGGKGFSSPIPFASGASTHYGLQGMRERVTVLGGALAIESAPGAGTVVSVQIARTNN
jgi:signal transduction histidine kinase